MSQNAKTQQTAELFPLWSPMRKVAAVDCIDHDLTDQTASVIRLCYREGMSYKDTAEELGISISAVNKQIVKRMRTLREKLKGK